MKATATLKEIDREARASARAIRARNIVMALELEKGNRTRAARRLGYQHTGDLLRAIRSLGLKLRPGRPGRPPREE